MNTLTNIKYAFVGYLSNNNYSKSTINSYEIAVGQFTDFLDQGRIHIESVNPAHFNAYAEQLKTVCSVQTCNSKIFALIKFVEFLNMQRKKKNKIDWKPKIQKNNNRKYINIFNKTLYSKFINNINCFEKEKRTIDRNKLFFEILYHTGSRSKDILRIKVKDMSEDSIIISGKSVVLNNEIIHRMNNFILEQRIDLPDQYIFTPFLRSKRPVKSHLTEKSIEEFFRKYKKGIADDYTIRDFRSSNHIETRNNINLNIESINSHITINSEIDMLKIILS